MDQRKAGKIAKKTFSAEDIINKLCEAEVLLAQEKPRIAPKMMQNEAEQERNTQIAIFRYGLIASLVFAWVNNEVLWMQSERSRKLAVYFLGWRARIKVNQGCEK